VQEGVVHRGVCEGVLVGGLQEAVVEEVHRDVSRQITREVPPVVLDERSRFWFFLQGYQSKRSVFRKRRHRR
jgi:hypothetical protein